MKTNYQMLLELLQKYHPEARGFISKNEHDLVKETLCLDKMDILQLRNLRDFTVAHMGRSEDIEDLDRMGAITYCIDSRIVELGGEV